MAKKKPTVADARANKGKRQYTTMRVENWEELAAAEANEFKLSTKVANKADGALNTR